MKKTFLFFVFLLLVSISSILALGSNEGRMYYLPMNVANNTNVMVELSQPKSVTKDKIHNLEEQANTEESHLVVFRLRDNLMTNSGNTTFNAANIELNLKSTSNWEFVHEENPTKRIPFEISIYCNEKKYSDDGEYGSFQTSNNLLVNPVLPLSNIQSTAEKNLDTITLSMPTSSVNDKKSWGFVIYPYPLYIRDYYFCITIPEHAVTESGYYSTTINLTSDNYYEVGLEKRHVNLLIVNFDYYELKKESSPKAIDNTIATITIRGYIGKEPGTDSGSYSFMVSNTTKTYSMDLGISDPNEPYDVAKIYFYNTKLLNGVSESIVNSTTNFSDYKIYISPERSTTSNADYKFRLIGSETDTESDENTIYYDLYINPKGSGLTALKDCSNYTSSSNYTNYKNSVTSNYSVSKLGGVKTTGSVFTLYPQYSYSKTSSGNDWQQIWQTDTTLFIKLQKRSTDTAETHLNGMYMSTLYFTVESP